MRKVWHGVPGWHWPPSRWQPRRASGRPRRLTRLAENLSAKLVSDLEQYRKTFRPSMAWPRGAGSPFTTRHWNWTKTRRMGTSKVSISIPSARRLALVVVGAAAAAMARPASGG